MTPVSFTAFGLDCYLIDDKLCLIDDQRRTHEILCRSVEYDSWFYPKDGKARRGGTLEWIGLKDVFPSGMEWVALIIVLSVLV